MNSYISKQVNLSHCKVIVFSEKVAVDGISKEVDSLVNNIQVRPDTFIIVSKCQAKNFIENSKPDLETSVSQYYEITPKSNEYTGFTDYMTIGKFYNNLCSDTSEPYAILSGINNGTNTNSFNTSSDSEKDSSILAGETSFEGKPASETIGLAVFKGDKLVGELTAIESIAHLIITNDFKSTTISVVDPTNSSNTIDLYLYNNKKNKIKVDIVNGSPYVTINCYLNARISSIDKNSDYTSSEMIDAISESTNKYLEEHISSYLYKTAKVYNSDISGIGNHAISKFSTLKKWNDYNWLNNYQNSFFNVNVDTNVKSGFLLSKE